MHDFLIMSYRDADERREPRTRPLPVRLHRSTRSRLAKAAASLGSTPSGIIRLALIQQLDEIERGVIRIRPVA